MGKMLLLTIIVLIVFQIMNYGRIDSATVPEICDECTENCTELEMEYDTETLYAVNILRQGPCLSLSLSDIPEDYDEQEQEQEPVETRFSVESFEMLPKKCGPINTMNFHRVFNGVRSNIYEFPWMALISYRTSEGLQFRCSGTIINSLYILTAAHCVHGKNVASVRVGEFDKSNKTDCQKKQGQTICETHIQDIDVVEKIVHENYSDPVINDIALLRLREEINFNYKNVAKICLPTTDYLRNVNISGNIGEVCGWGVTETGVESNVLRKISIPVLSDNECHNMLDGGYAATGGSNARLNLLHSNEFCAGKDGKDSCKGDSGGPFVMIDEYNDAFRNVQFGIVSRGATDCGSRPGIYTDVRKHIDWIIDKMNTSLLV